MTVVTTRFDNLFSGVDAEVIKEEINEILLENGDFKLEKIVSQGQETPDGQWLEQETNEWVILLTGKAKLLFADEQEACCMQSGDYVHIPAYKRHRVEWTDPEQKTIWLALHYCLQGDDGERNLLENPSESFIRREEVIRRRNRRKTISARIIKDVMYVYVPNNISDDNLRKVIDNFKQRFEKQRLKRQLNKEQDLKAIAEGLNKKYFSGKLQLNLVKYVTDQYSKFGCCNYHTRSIRISHRVSHMPDWVRDYVLVHELAHLIEPNHSQAFWKIVSGYELSERARGYLIAKGLDSMDR